MHSIVLTRLDFYRVDTHGCIIVNQKIHLTLLTVVVVKKLLLSTVSIRYIYLRNLRDLHDLNSNKYLFGHADYADYADSIIHPIHNSIDSIINIIGGEIRQDTKLYTHQLQICPCLLEKHLFHFKNRLKLNNYLIIN